MADECRDGDGATASVRSFSHSNCKIKEAGGGSRDGVDSISSLPDEILQIILSYIPTRIAIRTSSLSTRWRHVWSDTPSLLFGSYRLKADSVNKALARYKACKMTSFKLYTSMIDNVSYIDRWIEFAMSRNVENMSLVFKRSDDYKIPDFFYVNPVVKQLNVKLHLTDMILRCSVSWTSLKKLSLRCSNLSDESFANILSGCPILESLTLYSCNKLRVLDLSKSPRLRTLKIASNPWVQGPTQIVAPHIHYLRFTNSQLPCTLVDVSSLIEAKLDFGYSSPEKLKAGVLQVMALEMLNKLQNVENLTFGANFLKILSLAEIRRIPFPSFKVKDLTLKTMISQYVIPGIVRMLQDSPELKKLTVHTMDRGTTPEEYLDNYLGLHSWNVDSKNVASFKELMLKNTKALVKMHDR